jgi:TQXA domain-containing protein
MQMHMKLRFRVIAMCLVAVLLIGVLPSGSVYADNNDNIGEGPPGEISQVQMAEEVPAPGPDADLTTDASETKAASTVSEQTSETADDSEAAIDAESEEIDEAAEEEVTEEEPETSEGEVTPQETGDTSDAALEALNAKVEDALEDDDGTLLDLLMSAPGNGAVIAQLAERFGVSPELMELYCEAIANSGAETMALTSSYSGYYVGITDDENKNVGFHEPRFYVKSYDSYNSAYYSSYYGRYIDADNSTGLTVAYCFNAHLTMPDNTLDGYHYSETYGGNVAASESASYGGGYTLYQKLSSVSASTFAAAATGEVVTANELYQHVLSIALNGYPNNLSGFNTDENGNQILADEAFRALTQLAIWHYTDNDAGTLSMTDAERKIYNELINSVVTDAQLSALGISGYVNLYQLVECTGESSTGYQNLLAVSTISSPPKSLTIAKEVSGSASQQNEAFTFDITVSGTTKKAYQVISDSENSDGTAPAYTSIDLSSGTAQVQLKHGQSITILGLSSGYSAKVVEEQPSGYTTTVTKSTAASYQDTATSYGSVTDTHTKVTYLNTATDTTTDPSASTYDLTLKNTIGNAQNGDTVTYKITLKDSSGSLLPDTQTSSLSNVISFSNGVGTVDMYSGSSMTLTLPAGTKYQIDVVDENGFTLDSITKDGSSISTESNSGSMTADTVYSYVYKRIISGSFPAAQTGQVVISKAVDGTNRDDTFTYTLEVSMQKYSGGTGYSLTYPRYLEAELGTIREDGEKPTFSSTYTTTSSPMKWTGSATQYTFTLKAGQYIILSGFDDAAYYSSTYSYFSLCVQETDSSGNNLSDYSTTVNGSVSSAKRLTLSNFTAKETRDVAFVNTYTGSEPNPASYKLTLNNTLNNGETGDTVTYKITLKDSSGSLLPDTQTSSLSNVISFSNGVGTIDLASGSSMTLTLPEGTQYQIEVQDKNGFTLDTITKDSASISTEKNSGSLTADTVYSYVYTKPKSDSHTLTLGKTAQGASDSASQQFTFEIYLWKGDNSKASGALTGTYGGVTFTQTTDTLPCQDGTNYYGYGTVTLKSGQTVQLTDLPDGYSYYISEANSQDYYVSLIECTKPDSGGEYDSDTTNRYAWQKDVDFDGYVQFTNTYGPHSLRIAKKILNVTDDERDDEFEFTVYLYKHGSSSNTALNSSSSATYSIETYGEDGAAAPSLGSTMTFTKTTTTLPGAGYGTYNVATFKLKHGQSVVIQGLPEDFGYYAVEAKNAKYSLKQIYYMKAYLDDGTELPTKDGYSFNEQYTYLNDSKIRAGAEFVNANFDMSISKKLVNSSTTDDFTFKVYLTRYSTDSGDDLEPVTGTFDLSYQNRTGSDVPQTVTFTDNKDSWSVGQVKVAAGQTVTIKGLPYGVNYKIEEATPAYYKAEPTTYDGGDGFIWLDSANNVRGTAAPDESTSGTVDDKDLNVDVSVTYTNTYSEPTVGTIPTASTGQVVISKAVANTDKDEEFTFTLYLASRSGSSLTGYTGSSLTSSQINSLQVTTGTIRTDGEKPTFDKSNLTTVTSGISWTGSGSSMTFTLKNGQYIILSGFPYQYYVFVRETSNPNYKITVDGASGTGTGYGGLSTKGYDINFVNTYVEPTSCSLKISNTVQDDSGASIPGVPFTYTITLTDDSGNPYTGTFDGVTFTNGTATFTLEDGEEKTISGMPEGYSYTIVQTVQSDYTATVETPANATQSGTTTALTVTESGVTTPETEVKFLNVSKPAETLSGNVLSIHKEVTGSVSNLDVVQNYEEFGFTVYLYAASSSYSTPRAISTSNLKITGSSTIAGVEAPVTDNITFKTESYSNGYYTGYASVAAVYLTHGQTITISGIPSGCYYRVEETSCTSGGTSLSAYSTTVSGGDTNSSYSRYSYGSFSSTNGNVTVNFTNRRTTAPSTHKLTFTKTVENGGDVQNQEDFYFRVRLCTSFNHSYHTGSLNYEAKFTPLKDLKITGGTIQSGVTSPALEDLDSTTLSYAGYEASGTDSSTGSTYSYPCIGSVTDISFTLKNGQSIVIDNLPDYYCYQVIETDADGAKLENTTFNAFSDDNYTSSVKVTQGSQSVTPTGLAVGYNQLQADHRVDYTNSYTAPATRDLTISKTVTGGMGDKAKAFTFDIALKDSSGKALTQQITTSEGTTLNPDESGIYKVQLKHGESVTLKDLPVGTQYSVTEEGAEEYQTTIVITGGSYYAQSGKSRSGAVTESASEIKVDVTNQYDISITGIRTENLPFIILTAFAVGLLLLLMIGKRKSRKEM